MASSGPVHAGIVKYTSAPTEDTSAAQASVTLWRRSSPSIIYLDLLNCIIQHLGPQDAFQELVAARYETGSHGLFRRRMD